MKIFSRQPEPQFHGEHIVDIIAAQYPSSELDRISRDVCECGEKRDKTKPFWDKQARLLIKKQGQGNILLKIRANDYVHTERYQEYQIQASQDIPGEQHAREVGSIHVPFRDIFSIIDTDLTKCYNNRLASEIGKKTKIISWGHDGNNSFFEISDLKPESIISLVTAVREYNHIVYSSYFKTLILEEHKRIQQSIRSVVNSSSM